MGIRFGRMAREVMERIDGLYEHSIVRQYGSPHEAPAPGGPEREGATSE
jgi:hypothetical protein